jgi:roadblock/LC7 domain-containing protein
MSRSSKLRKLPGVLAAGIFSRKGTLEEYEGPFTSREATALAGLCSDITLTMEMQALFLERLSGEEGWKGCYGWAAWGPERAIVSVGDSMCIVDAQAGSLATVISTMRSSAGIEDSESEGV